MSNNRHVALTIGLFLVILAVGGLLMLWPTYSEIRTVCHEVETLDRKVEFLTDRTRLVDNLRAQLADEEAYIERELKAIPETSDMAGLMRHLSLPVDGVTVLDQTITAGSPTPAIALDPEGAQVMPLTIDMEASFDSVFALVEAAESQRRLVRVTTVRVQCDRKPDNTGPTVTASIGLDAVYQPVTLAEGH